MLFNYLKVAFRNLWKNKGFSAINIFGLAIGLATCLLIILYVLDELSYDRFHKKADRIYRVDSDIKFGGNHFVLAVAPDPMGAALKKDYPQVEQYLRFHHSGDIMIKKGSEYVQEDRVVYADSTLFDVFSLPLIDGDPHTALKESHSLVLTESMARKYFNETHVAGRSLLLNNHDTYKITAVIRDLPATSHFHFDFFLPMAELAYSRENNWVSNNYTTYIVLKEGADPKQLEAQFDGMVEKYIGPQINALLPGGLEEFKKNGNHEHYELTPLSRIHLHSNKTGELDANGSIQYVYIFSAIALFILLIACVNFMNLSTARSANRAKEVGIRKVMGSLKANLIKQFLTESILISALALVLALLIAWMALPYFNELSERSITFGFDQKPWLLPTLLLMVLITGLLAGSYPAFYLSSFQPIQVIKGKLATGFRSGWLHSSLVVFQFAISIVLIIGTIVIFKQMHYIQSRKIGFDRNQVLVLHGTNVLGNQAKAFRNEVVNMPGVVNATMTGFLPTSDRRSDSPLFTDPTLDQKSAVSSQTWYVDYHYIPTLGMHLLKGRNFSAGFQTDSSAIIINEAAAKLFAFKDPINKNLYYINDFNNKSDITTYHIIGIVKNFNFNSMREQVTPMALIPRESNSKLAVRLSTKNIPALLAQIENKFKTMAPGQPFRYSFMDEDFSNLYRSEQRMGRIALTFSLLAIFIACLGLFGLAAYAAEQRTREIGIRKVLGATISNITTMLSMDFLKLVTIAALIAFPLAGWTMNNWLNDFAYRIHISWWIFAMAGLLALLIAIVTISFQAIRAAFANPIKSLRSE